MRSEPITVYHHARPAQEALDSLGIPPSPSLREMQRPKASRDYHVGGLLCGLHTIGRPSSPRSPVPAGGPAGTLKRRVRPLLPTPGSPAPQPPVWQDKDVSSVVRPRAPRPTAESRLAPGRE